MQASGFDYYAIGDAALELGVARSNLRFWIDIGKVSAKRASDGSRLLSPADVKAARLWISEHEAKRKRQKIESRKARESALRRIKERRTA